jgi:hypothetical protein
MLREGRREHRENPYKTPRSQRLSGKRRQFEIKKDAKMNVLKSINLGVRFLLELCMLAAVGYWGFKTGSGWFLKILLGIGGPLSIAVVWGMFVAPKAAYPLHGFALLALEAILFGLGVAALYLTKNYALAWSFAAVVVINRILIYVWGQ